MKTLLHSPEKYPMLENYSGWETHEIVVLNGKEYPQTDPIYTDLEGGNWSQSSTVFFYDENKEFQIVTFSLKATSAQALLQAINALNSITVANKWATE